MRFILPALALLGVVAASQARQSTNGITVTPFSDFRDQTGYDGAESPNGKFFATADLSDNYVFFNRSTGRWATDSTLKPWQLRWSPDGRFMSFTRALPGTRDRYVWVVPMDTATGRPRGTPRRISMRKGAWSEWSPDGRRIAFVSEDSGVTRVVAVPFNGGDEEILFETRGPFGPPNYKRITWSPDGSSMLLPAVATHWNRLTLRTRKLDSLGLAAMGVIGYSGDGKRIAQFNYFQKLIIISSASDGAELQRFDLPQRVFLTGWSTTAPNALTGLHNPIPQDVQRVSLPDGTASTVVPVAEEIGGPSLSPDGRRIVFTRLGLTSSQVFVANVDGSNQRSIAAGVAIESPRWSPDGKHVAYVTSQGFRRLHVVEVATASSRVLVSTGPNTALGATGWRSDGQAIRYAWWPRGGSVAEREAREVTLNGASRFLAPLPIAAADLNTNRQSRPQFINDTLALLRSGSGITAVNLRTGASKSLYSGAVRDIDDFGISPDGEQISFAFWNRDHSTPALLSLKTGEFREVPYTLGVELGEVRFHPDGRQLVATACTQCNNDERWDVVLVPLNGDQTRVLTANQKSYRSFGNLSVTPDGRGIIFSGEKSWNMRLVTVTLPTR